VYPGNKRIIRYLAGILILAGMGITVIAGLASGTRWFQTDNIREEPVVGALAPGFTLTALTGEQVRLADSRGKPVLINFWATWCAPCVIEMPNIQKYYEANAGEIEVLAVNADEPASVVQKFIDDIGVTFTILLDPGAVIQDVYRIRGYPTTFFLDAKGIIRVQHIGLLSEKQIEAYLLMVDIGK